MRSVRFSPEALEEFLSWRNEPNTVKKILDLVEDTLRHPFEGLGKPEHLKHDLKEYWSRRITGEHRFVYKVTDSEILVARCRNHYKK